jgi:hypothetical protein
LPQNETTVSPGRDTKGNPVLRGLYRLKVWSALDALYAVMTD